MLGMAEPCAQGKATSVLPTELRSEHEMQPITPSVQAGPAQMHTFASPCDMMGSLGASPLPPLASRLTGIAPSKWVGGDDDIACVRQPSHSLKGHMPGTTYLLSSQLAVCKFTGAAGWL